MSAHCYLDPWQQIELKFEIKIQHFIQKKKIITEILAAGTKPLLEPILTY